MALTVLIVALVAASGLLACWWGALSGRSTLANLSFYLGGLVGLWAAIALVVLLVVGAITGALFES